MRCRVTNGCRFPLTVVMDEQAALALALEATANGRHVCVELYDNGWRLHEWSKRNW